MKQHTGIAITGMGCVSAIGMDVSEQLASLRHAQHGIRPIQLLETTYRGKFLAGEIPFTNGQLMDQLGLPAGTTITRTGLLAMLAIREALAQANVSPTDGLRTGLISATTVGGMDITEKYYDDYLVSEKNRHFIATHPCGQSTEQLAQHFGIKDHVSTISTACSSSANAIMLGARMIKAGLLDRVIVGGTDSLSRFTVNGFNSLMIYSDTYCTPFDANRKGLNLGEGAAYLVMEAELSLLRTNNRPLAYLSGYANANDAFHQTASSDEGEGAYLAMKATLEVANIPPYAVSYVNAHGTATPNNDLSEGRAMLSLFGSREQIPAFSSTKAFTGHTLAAAGAIEAVFSILAIQEQHVLPGLNFSNPIPELELIPKTSYQPTEIEHVLSNSLGFGGNCSALLFSRYHA